MPDDTPEQTASPNDDSPLMGVPEFAKAVGRSQKTVYHWLKVGRIPGVLVVGRWAIPRSFVAQILERAHMVAPPAMTMEAPPALTMAAPRGAAGRGGRR